MVSIALVRERGRREARSLRAGGGKLAAGSKKHAGHCCGIKRRPNEKVSLELCLGGISQREKERLDLKVNSKAGAIQYK